MLYDRSYMRNEPQRKAVPYLYWIMGVILGMFILQNVLAVWVNLGNVLPRFLALGPGQLLNAKIWTLLTYSLVGMGFFQVLFNILIIFFTGRMLEPTLGHKRILWAYLVSTLVGGVVWTAVHFQGGLLIGATSGALGLLALYCLMQPDQPITLLLFFVVPVTLRPKWILWIALGFAGFGFLFIELPEVFQQGMISGVSGIDFSAQLGGILGAYLYYRFAMNRPKSWTPFQPRISVEQPSWFKKQKKQPKPRKFKLNVNAKEGLRKEVDRILDKINKEGFGSLDETEKKILEEAKELLKK